MEGAAAVEMMMMGPVLTVLRSEWRGRGLERTVGCHRLEDVSFVPWNGEFGAFSICTLPTAHRMGLAGAYMKRQHQEERRHRDTATSFALYLLETDGSVHDRG